MSVFDTIWFYAERLALVITLITGVGWLAAKRKQKRQIEGIFRTDSSGAVVGPGAPAGRLVAPVRLEPSGWRIFGIFPDLFVTMFPLLLFFTFLGACASSVGQGAVSRDAVFDGLLFWAAIYALFLIIGIPLETSKYLWSKLSRLSWMADAHGVTIRRWGRDEFFDWREVDSARVGPGWIELTIGAPGAHLTSEVRLLSPAPQARAVAMAQSAGVRIVPWNQKKKKGA